VFLQGDGIKVYGSQAFPDDSSAWVAVSNVDATSNGTALFAFVCVVCACRALLMHCALANQLWLSENFAYVFSFNTIFYSFSLLQRTPIPPVLPHPRALPHHV
jgi:hypothetical protein